MWKGDISTAEGCFAYAVSLDAKFAEAQLNYGTALRANGKLTEAEATYREVAKLRPDWAEVHFNLGVLYLDAEQIPKHDEIAKLNAAVKEFESYKSLVAKGTTSVERSKSQRGPTDAMGNELVSVAQADLYIKAASKGIEMEQRRQERDAKRKQKEEKAAETAVEDEAVEGETAEGETAESVPVSAPSEPAKPQAPGGQPSEPAKPQKPGEQPSAPAPSQPPPTQPSQPTPTQPSQPPPTQPSQPTPTQPSQPTPTQPSKPAPTQPSQPTPTQPSKPAPTQPSQPLLMAYVACHASNHFPQLPLLRLAELALIGGRDFRTPEAWQALDTFLTETGTERFAFPALTLAQALVPDLAPDSLIRRIAERTPRALRRLVHRTTPATSLRFAAARPGYIPLWAATWRERMSYVAHLVWPHRAGGPVGVREGLAWQVDRLSRMLRTVLRRKA
jgi:hypothetical protein